MPTISDDRTLRLPGQMRPLGGRAVSGGAPLPTLRPVASK